MKKFIRYAITLLIGFIVAVPIFFFRYGGYEINLQNTYRFLSDAALLPGVFMGSVGLLIIVDRGGTFDMLIFGVRKVFGRFRKDDSSESFYEYRMAKEEREKTSIAHVFFGAAFFLGLAIIFTLCFLAVEVPTY